MGGNNSGNNFLEELRGPVGRATQDRVIHDRAKCARLRSDAADLIERLQSAIDLSTKLDGETFDAQAAIHESARSLSVTILQSLGQDPAQAPMIEAVMIAFSRAVQRSSINASAAVLEKRAAALADHQRRAPRKRIEHEAHALREAAFDLRAAAAPAKTS